MVFVPWQDTGAVVSYRPSHAAPDDEPDAISAVVLVEGPSDRAAVEATARSLGRDLRREAVVVLPIGGAHAIGRLLTRPRTWPDGVRLAGLCDEAEVEVYRRGLHAGGLGSPGTRGDLERLGFFVCVHDLEDELIRAVGAPQVEALFREEGDLASFRSMQRQPAWRDRELAAQQHRFLGSGAHRKIRYARVLAEAAAAEGRVPAPLLGVLGAV